MAEYIERDAAYPIAKKVVDAITNGEYHAGVFAYDIMDWIDELPAADVAPIKRGKWVKTKEYYTVGCDFLRVAWECSCCGIEVVNTEPICRIDDWYYCPNCGAMMEES